MPQVSVDDLLRAARAGKPVAPVIYLHGPEDLLKDEIVRTVIEQVLDPGLREFNLDQRSAAQLDPEAVYSLCHTPPMMAERRVVVIRDVEAWRGKTKAKAKDVVLRYLEQPSADTIVFLVQGGAQEEEDKEFAKRALAVCCEPLPPERAIKWVLRRARQRGVAIDPAAAEHLVRAVGCDLSALASEFDKRRGGRHGGARRRDRRHPPG
jgi:DNA polymerase-3 subunit delta